MKEHEHTASHEPAAQPVPGEVAKDAGSKHPAHHADHATWRRTSESGSGSRWS